MKVGRILLGAGNTIYACWINLFGVIKNPVNRNISPNGDFHAIFGLSRYILQSEQTVTVLAVDQLQLLVEKFNQDFLLSNS